MAHMFPNLVTNKIVGLAIKVIHMIHTHKDFSRCSYCLWLIINIFLPIYMKLVPTIRGNYYISMWADQENIKQSTNVIYFILFQVRKHPLERHHHSNVIPQLNILKNQLKYSSTRQPQVSMVGLRSSNYRVYTTSLDA